MYKIFKTRVTGFDLPGYSDSIGLNPNIRATMGYNDSTKVISVIIDKIVRPENDRDEAATLTYETITSREFTKVDFPQNTDNLIWVVEYDCETNTIKDPLDVLEYTKSYISGSDTHQSIHRIIKNRYSDKLIPLFNLESFYKNAEGFSASVLTFHEADSTVITSEAEEITTQDRIKEIITTVNTNVFYEVLDENDNVLNVSIVSPFGDALGGFSKIRGSQYVVNLPADTSYKIRVNYSRGLPDKQLQTSFDVDCINGVPSKNRLTSGIKAGQTCPDYSYLGSPYSERLTTNFAGFEIVKISNQLEAGDFIKFKLNCGSQITYSELQINLI